MKTLKVSTVNFVSTLAIGAIFSVPAALAQTREQGPWWPHPEWGPRDQAGASNRITPAKIVEAISLVRSGKTYELGHVYEHGMPLLGERSYNMVMPGLPTGGPIGQQGLYYNDEYVCSEIGQVGTQFDAPGHVSKRVTMDDGSAVNVYYNGFTADEIDTPRGLRKLGVENIKPFITRGILIDVAGYKGVDTLPSGYVVTLKDIEESLARQGLTEMDIRTGDALFLNFGWWRYWPDAERFNQQNPGIGVDVAEWIVEREVSMVGSDGATDEAGPITEPDYFSVHHDLMLIHGIMNLEFMTFESLLADDAYEFMFVFAPLRLKGATGSPGRPLAIR